MSVGTSVGTGLRDLARVILALEGDHLSTLEVQKVADELDWTWLEPKVLRWLPDAGPAIAALKEGVDPVIAGFEIRAPSTNGHAQLPKLVRALDAPSPPAQTWVVQPWIPAALPGLWIGPGGAGKDSTFLALAVAVATGRVPYGHDALEPPEPAPVVVASAEDPQSLILSRLHALIRGAGVDPQQALRNIHVYGAESGFTLSSSQWTEHLIDEVDRVAADLVMVGPLREIMEGSEDKSEAVAPVIARVRRICAETGAAVAINHHAGKPREGASRVDRIRGSSALHAFARWAVWIEGMPEGRVLMDTLKLTVGAPPEPWVLQRSISTSEDGSWWNARFEATKPETLARTDAERMVRQIIEQSPGSTSSEIRDYCAALKIAPTETGKAISTLERLGVITFEKGQRGSKLWRFADPASPRDARS